MVSYICDRTHIGSRIRRGRFYGHLFKPPMSAAAVLARPVAFFLPAFPMLFFFRRLPMQTLIKNGTIVNPQGRSKMDVLVEDGRIIALAPELRAPGAQVIQAKGCYVFPGFIDTHTHFDLDTGSAVTADDFVTAPKPPPWAVPPAYWISPPKSGMVPFSRHWIPGMKKPRAPAATMGSTWPLPGGMKASGPK